MNPSINDVHKIVGILDPLPLYPFIISCNIFSIIFLIENYSTPSLPLIALVIYG